jgi:murein DD-endopeptidase MepM/ murein hydrolase activator NlpD
VRGIGLLLILVVMMGCASTQGRRSGWYTLRKGDTLGLVAKRYRVTVQELAEWNNIQNPNVVSPGRRVNVPPRQRSRINKGKQFRKSDWGRGSSKISTYHGKFAWPVDGPVHSYYGIRKGRRHDGLDIGAKRGAPIRAAAAGTVAFSRRLSGYGKLIIVRHPGRYYSAYAHNARHYVKKGDRVRKGQKIASVGTTGRSSGPHLHFEIRRGQTARNPLFFLKPRNKRERAIARGASGSKKTVVASASKGRQGKTRALRGRRKWQKHVPKGRQAVRINKGFRRK